MTSLQKIPVIIAVTVNCIDPETRTRQTDRREAVKGPAQWINSQFGGRQVSTDAEY